ncbi:unnamed protein product [Diplocarpon coronariae]
MRTTTSFARSQRGWSLIAALLLITTQDRTGPANSTPTLAGFCLLQTRREVWSSTGTWATWPSTSRSPSPTSPTTRGYLRPGLDAPLAGGIPLRIMGLGASTVFGAESFDQTGWRRTLRQRLVRAGNPVNMVGAARTGDMVDNDVEAYPGVRLDEIYGYAQGSVPTTKPNLVILYAGSNDNFQNASLPLLFKRYHALAQYVLRASPRATLVMSTLMPTTETEMWGGQDRVGVCNVQLRRVFRVLRREGRPVVLVEMDDPDGVQIENLAWDHMHPSAAGYEIMSRKFFEAILEADARGFLQAPEYVDRMVDDGDEGRLDWQAMKKLREEARQKQAQEAAEEAAVTMMIEELQASPWDGEPPFIPPKAPVPPPSPPWGEGDMGGV